MDWFCSVIWILAAFVFIVWGIPFCRYIGNRVRLLFRLFIWGVRKDFFFVFHRWWSLLGFNHGKTADLLVVYGRKAYIIKLGGSFKRATKIFVSSPSKWLFKVYARSPSISGAIIMEPISKERNIRFDLIQDGISVRNKIYREVLLSKFTPIYMLIPKPWSIYWGENEAAPLSNGDNFYGMKLCTEKYFFRKCKEERNTLNGNGSLSHKEKSALRKAFHDLR